MQQEHEVDVAPTEPVLVVEARALRGGALAAVGRVLASVVGDREVRRDRNPITLYNPTL